MEPSAGGDVTLAQIQTALFGLSVNCALYAATYMAATSACVDGGLLAEFARRSVRSQVHLRFPRGAHARALSYARCFAAGVFLGALFLGMMPAVRLAVEEAQEKYATLVGAFPVAEALVFVGFCGAVYLDGRIRSTNRSAGTPPSVSARELPVVPRAEPTPRSSGADIVDSPHNSRTRLLREGSPQRNEEHVRYAVATPSQHDVVSEPPPYCADDNHTDGPSAACRLAFIVGAMAVNSVLEGLMLGHQPVLRPYSLEQPFMQQKAAKLMWLVVGLYMHKTLTTAAVAMYAAAMEHSSFVSASAGLVVASTVPAGQMAALVIGREIDSLHKLLVLALAVGTFFYVTLTEVLPPELSRQQDRIVKVTFMIIGFALIATATITSNHIAHVYG
ncbi:hypothetical protein HPB50_003015 [Hyalomma asiaticum]|uniref:Uncharacterized protein n=1 Tax=Hyalomma asiaticum TaxID=266040 RepID=A0ACB7T118_HYAAI|nr:hypothetical protein HPB50_003015 [Hyalomma asiaticum]